MNRRSIVQSILVLFWAAPALAQPCPILQGEFKCGSRGQSRYWPLEMKTEGNRYSFGGPKQPTFHVIADGKDREGVLGGPDKQADYRAVCDGQKLIIDFRMNVTTGGQKKLMVARDSFYMERGGLVRVRLYDQNSEVKRSPSVVSCSPVITRRPPSPPEPPIQSPAEPPKPSEDDSPEE